jgi:cathepsin H
MYHQYQIEYKPEARPSAYYKDVSNAARKEIFAAKLRDIIQHNSNPSMNWQKGLNEYSDMSDLEFTNYFNIVGDAQQCSATYESAKKTVPLEVNLKDVPAHWDWRDFGVVTPVKNQGKCGSCWTFSTVGAMESHFMKKYGQFRNLSEQQLVDCAGDFDNYGCNGGLPSHAFEYIMFAGGIATEADYPY